MEALPPIVSEGTKSTKAHQNMFKDLKTVTVGNYDGFYSGTISDKHSSDYHHIYAGPLVCLSYSPTGKHIAAASIEGSIKILDPTNKTLHYTFEGVSDSNLYLLVYHSYTTGTTAQPVCICYSPCRCYLATAFDPNKLVIMDLQSMKEHTTTNFHNSGRILLSM